MNRKLVLALTSILCVFILSVVPALAQDEFVFGLVLVGPENDGGWSQAHDVGRQWAQDNGHDPLLRIALCGYGDEHDNLLEHGWTREEWRARRGYQSIDEDGTHTGHQERIWFSPHCLTPETASPLFAEPIP